MTSEQQQQYEQWEQQVLDRDRQLFYGALGDAGIVAKPNGMFDFLTPDLDKVVLKKGDSGNKVRTLQEDLNKAGFKTTISSKYDDQTVKSVKAFQRSVNLSASGVYDKGTKKALGKTTGKAISTQEGLDIFQAGLYGIRGQPLPGTEIEEERDSDTGGGGGDVPSTNWLLWGGLAAGGVITVVGLALLLTRS